MKFDKSLILSVVIVACAGAALLTSLQTKAEEEKIDCQGVYEGTYAMMRDRYEFSIIEMLKKNPESKDAIIEAFQQPMMMSEEGRHRAANAEAEKYFLICVKYNATL